VDWTGEGCHDVWEEVFVLCLLLLPVHFLQVLLRKRISQPSFDFVLAALGWVDEAHKEHWGNSEPEHSLNKDPHDLQVHYGLEQFLEVMKTLGDQLVVAGPQLLPQLGLQVLVGNVSVTIVLKLLGLELVLFQLSYIVSSHIGHAGNSEKLVAVGVLVAQVLVTAWHYSSQLHPPELFSLLCLKLCLDNLRSLGLVFDILVLVLDVGHGPLLPVLKVLLIEVEEEGGINFLEFVKHFLVHHHQYRGQDRTAMGIYKKLVANLFLVYEISQVLDHQGGTFLLYEGVELVLEGILLVHLLLELFVAGLLDGDDLGSDHLKRLVHWELV